jgi:nitrogen regulatory protein PII
MKRIELVMDNLALDAFRHTAAALGILEFELQEVRRSSPHYFETRRFYRGQSYTLELSPRAKVEFIVADHEVERLARVLTSGIRPDSICIFEICQLVHLDGEASAAQRPRPARETGHASTLS